MNPHHFRNAPQPRDWEIYKHAAANICPSFVRHLSVICPSFVRHSPPAGSHRRSPCHRHAAAATRAARKLAGRGLARTVHAALAAEDGPAPLVASTGSTLLHPSAYGALYCCGVMSSKTALTNVRADEGENGTCCCCCRCCCCRCCSCRCCRGRLPVGAAGQAHRTESRVSQCVGGRRRRLDSPASLRASPSF